MLQANHASFVNGKPVVDQTVLHDGDVIRLGSTVEIEFRQPSPVSATARLSIVSRHRLPLAVEGVLLMAETCIVSEAIQCISRLRPSRTRSSSIVRQAPVVPGRGAFDVDGRTCALRTSDFAVQRSGRRIFVQFGTVGKSSRVESEPRLWQAGSAGQRRCHLNGHRSISQTVLAG